MRATLTCAMVLGSVSWRLAIRSNAKTCANHPSPVSPQPHISWVSPHNIMMLQSSITASQSVLKHADERTHHSFSVFVLFFN